MESHVGEADTKAGRIRLPFNNVHVVEPFEKNNPDFTCPGCNLACFVEEYGDAGRNDDEPIDCPTCGRRLGTFSTTGYLHKHWKPLSR